MKNVIVERTMNRVFLALTNKIWCWNYGFIVPRLLARTVPQYIDPNFPFVYESRNQAT